MRHCYIDSSAALRWLLNAPGRDPGYGDWEYGVSSVVLDLEVRRTLHRLLLSGDLKANEYQACLTTHVEMTAGMALVNIDARVLAFAGSPFPMAVRSLDALHVASALLYQQEFETGSFQFLTHDRDQGQLAGAMGLVVHGI